MSLQGFCKNWGYDLPNSLINHIKFCTGYILFRGGVNFVIGRLCNQQLIQYIE